MNQLRPTTSLRESSPVNYSAKRVVGLLSLNLLPGLRGLKPTLLTEPERRKLSVLHRLMLLAHLHLLWLAWQNKIQKRKLQTWTELLTSLLNARLNFPYLRNRFTNPKPEFICGARTGNPTLLKFSISLLRKVESPIPSIQFDPYFSFRGLSLFRKVYEFLSPYFS